MKILATVTALTLCLLAGTAYAGDSTYNWSGIYGGAGIGYVHGTQDWKLPAGQFWAPFGGENGFTFNQFEVGAHIGAQYQWKWLVFGAEVGIYKGPDDEQSERSPYFPATDEWRADINTIAKATAKVGYAYKRFLFYAKGGYAGARVDTETRFPDPGIIVFDNTTSTWRSGWTVGGGIEYALTKHIIVGAEYSYLDLGSQTQSDRPLVPPINFKADVDAAVHQVLFRISYKFDVF